MKWMTSIGAVALLGVMTSAAACITPIDDDVDYSAMSTNDLEDLCAEAMAEAREAAPGDGPIMPGEEGGSKSRGEGKMQACALLQERLAAEGK